MEDYLRGGDVGGGGRSREFSGSFLSCAVGVAVGVADGKYSGSVAVGGRECIQCQWQLQAVCELGRLGCQNLEPRDSKLGRLV